MNIGGSDREAPLDCPQPKCPHCGQELGAERRLGIANELLLWALLLSVIALILSNIR